MGIDIEKIIFRKDIETLKKELSENPILANEGVLLADGNTLPAHPLHRVCDAVFAKKITDNDAVEMAKILLEYGANIDGDGVIDKKDSPLLAAASLHAEQTGIFYVDRGANVHFTGNDGETALHWAAYCGRDKLTKRLIEAGADINKRDTSYNSTPLGWAVHNLAQEDNFNTYHQLECIKQLLKAGADVNMLGKDAVEYLHTIAGKDAELKALLCNRFTLLEGAT
ncbi:MAG TPA: ankyrin repeat domain-containing protein [Chitinophagaceae bacterium]|nr:ankyrin repeat domain-containing protein [Chitinophagaceae bacterium]